MFENSLRRVLSIKCQGLFFGASLEASAIGSRPDVNRAFYGEKISVSALLSGEYPPPKGAELLYKAIHEVKFTYLVTYRLRNIIFSFACIQVLGSSSYSSRNIREQNGFAGKFCILIAFFLTAHNKIPTFTDNGSVQYSQEFLSNSRAAALNPQPTSSQSSYRIAHSQHTSQRSQLDEFGLQNSQKL